MRFGLFVRLCRLGVLLWSVSSVSVVICLGLSLAGFPGTMSLTLLAVSLDTVAIHGPLQHQAHPSAIAVVVVAPTFHQMRIFCIRIACANGVVEATHHTPQKKSMRVTV